MQLAEMLRSAGQVLQGTSMETRPPFRPDVYASAPPVDRRFWPMYSPHHLGITLFRGWKSIIERASDQICDLLNGTDLTFQWISLDEQDGVAHLLYSLTRANRYLVELRPAESHRVVVQIEEDVAFNRLECIESIAWEIERLSSEACIVCGARVIRAQYFGRFLPLCTDHQPEATWDAGEEGLEGVWRLAVEWTELPSGSSATWRSTGDAKYDGTRHARQAPAELSSG